ncbi:MAG: hypothetical protein A3G41_08530 [Elusimicrobia bacterium RIFCSPLOWO2_12_FULL_59_9]|nr:MAG: hypothetical protein A3G41_08530 [Elusimicrobia bacterium RIFCSPLOWO2_12_FULL_59_9]
MKGDLKVLRTELGDRPFYDSVSQCNRCGYCESVCPTYVLTGKESYSGRGRNQIIRLILEGKLDNPNAAEDALSTCLLCGACTAACYARVATVDHVLEARRGLRNGRLPILAGFLMKLLADRRPLLDRILKIAYALKRTGLPAWAGRTGLLKLAGLSALQNADSHVHELPRRFLSDIWRGRSRPAAPQWFYLTLCGPNYLYPKVGESTVAALDKIRGEGEAMENACCGLLHFNYGDLNLSRSLARRNIEIYERRRSQTGLAGPVIGDCSSCVAHLKSYPQLFLDDPQWLPRAEAFSSNVKDSVESFSPSEALRLKRNWPQGVKVTYHDSCRARNAMGLARNQRQILKAVLGERFVELPQAEWCCGGAGAYSFVHPELSEDVLKSKISNIASTQAGIVLTSSTSCLLQIAYGLKKYYPSCRVMHFTEFLAQADD